MFQYIWHRVITRQQRSYSKGRNCNRNQPSIHSNEFSLKMSMLRKAMISLCRGCLLRMNKVDRICKFHILKPGWAISSASWRKTRSKTSNSGKVQNIQNSSSKILIEARRRMRRRCTKICRLLCRRWMPWYRKILCCSSSKGLLSILPKMRNWESLKILCRRRRHWASTRKVRNCWVCQRRTLCSRMLAPGFQVNRRYQRFKVLNSL